MSELIKNLRLQRPGGRSERELWQETEAKVNELVAAVNELLGHPTRTEQES